MAYLKRLLVFIGALLVIFGIYGSGFTAQVAGEEHGASSRPVSKSAALSGKNGKTDVFAYYASQLEKSGVALHPGTSHRKDSKETPESSARCKSIVYKTLLDLPVSHRKQLKDLTLFYSDEGRRGLGGNGSVVLRCNSVTDAELASVFTHEMGHLVDAGFFTGSENSGFSGFNDFDIPVFEDDASTAFYRISWVSETDIIFDFNELDFVSRYAMTDPFEDFAETYTYFRWHGPEFRVLAQMNDRLAQKYNFMMYYVFAGREFGNTDYFPEIDTGVRNYDVTVLPIL